MSAKLRDEITAAGRRLEVLAARVEALRDRLRLPAPGPAAPLFPPSAGGAGALDDVELHFQIDDAERRRQT
jgi:hypothetical protein